MGLMPLGTPNWQVLALGLSYVPKGALRHLNASDPRIFFYIMVKFHHDQLNRGFSEALKQGISFVGLDCFQNYVSVKLCCPWRQNT